jgi:hypothetical protein
MSESVIPKPRSIDDIHNECYFSGAVVQTTDDVLPLTRIANKKMA